MVVLLVLTLVIFVGAQEEYYYYEDDYDEPCLDGFIPDPDQCDKYWECRKGEVIPHLCPDGLVYDSTDFIATHQLSSSRSTGTCTFPFAIDCGSRKLLQEAQTTVKCPRRNGHFPHPDPTVCDKYHQCNEGAPSLLTCPQGLIFAPDQGRCTWIEEADRPGCTSQDKWSFNCPVVEGPQHARYPDPDDCQKFYVCISGSARRETCQRGLVFDPSSSACDRQESVQSGPCNSWYNQSEIAVLTLPNILPTPATAAPVPTPRRAFIDRRKSTKESTKIVIEKEVTSGEKKKNDIQREVEESPLNPSVIKTQPLDCTQLGCSTTSEHERRLSHFKVKLGGVTQLQQDALGKDGREKPLNPAGVQTLNSLDKEKVEPRRRGVKLSGVIKSQQKSRGNDGREKPFAPAGVKTSSSRDNEKSNPRRRGVTRISSGIRGRTRGPSDTVDDDIKKPLRVKPARRGLVKHTSLRTRTRKVTRPLSSEKGGEEETERKTPTPLPRRKIPLVPLSRTRISLRKSTDSNQQFSEDTSESSNQRIRQRQRLTLTRSSLHSTENIVQS